MMTSDEKTVVPALLKYVQSGLFTFGNLSNNVKLTVPQSGTSAIKKDGTLINPNSGNDVSSISWQAVVSYLPLEFFRIIESFPNIYTTEVFDKKYIRNPKLCAYERYETTNMWRPLMILNRCPSITQFDFEYIRYFNIQNFTKILNVLIARSQSHA